jgi:hypothetical protein
MESLCITYDLLRCLRAGSKRGKRSFTIGDIRSSRYGCGQGDDPTASGRLHVNVVHTSEEGTVAALAAAAHLAKDLCAHIRLVAAERVPIHFSLNRPHVSADFLEQRLCQFICDAGIGCEDVTIQVSLCRNPKRALAGLLAPHSLLVIAGNLPWWNRRECQVARWLRQQGHHVIFVNAADGKRSRPAFDRGRQAAFYRSLRVAGSR